MYGSNVWGGRCWPVGSVGPTSFHVKPWSWESMMVGSPSLNASAKRRPLLSTPMVGSPPPTPVESWSPRAGMALAAASGGSVALPSAWTTPSVEGAAPDATAAAFAGAPAGAAHPARRRATRASAKRTGAMAPDRRHPQKAVVVAGGIDRPDSQE